MLKKIICIFIVLYSFCSKTFAQENTDIDDSTHFIKYNRNILGPFSTGKPQLVFTTNYTVDIDYNEEDANPGNISPGINMGLGVGYNYVFQTYNSKISGALGGKAEWYPQNYWKFNAVIEADVAMISFGNKSNLILFSGFEPNITFNSDFSKKETHLILYFGEINVKNIELKYGMQIWSEWLTPIILLDNTIHVLKLSYKMDI